MTQWFLLVAAVMALVAGVFAQLWRIERAEKQALKESNERLKTLGNAQREEIDRLVRLSRVATEERKNADAKINAARTGDAASRFDTITSGLRNTAGDDGAA